MADRRSVVEGHLKVATTALERRTKTLAADKADKKKMRRDPKFRELEALVRKHKGQIAAIDKAEKVLADMKQRTAERLAQPKVKKVKKKAPVVAPKAKKEKKAKAEG